VPYIPSGQETDQSYPKVPDTCKGFKGWVKKVSYCTFSITSLNIDQFSHFFHQ